MAHVPGNDRTVSGKRLLPRLAVGCLVFSAVMGFGTWAVGKAITPWLEARFRAANPGR